MVLSDRAKFDLAMRLRSERGVAIGEVFAFISGLYFKGKLAYALEFARPPEPGTAIVITSRSATPLSRMSPEMRESRPISILAPSCFWRRT